MIAPLGCGGAPLGGLYEPVSDECAQATLEAAWQCGIRYFDTAPLYGLGLSERRLGRFLAGKPRHAFAVSTKVGRVLVPGPDGDSRQALFDFSADGIRRAIESSLQRLDLSFVDIAFIHDPDAHVDQAVREAFPAVRRLRDERIAGAVGVGMNQWQAPARFVRECDPDVVMIAGRYTLLDQSAGEELLPLCVEHGVDVAAAGAFNSGILARSDPRAGATYDYHTAPPHMLESARRIAAICERHGTTLAAAAIAFPLKHPAVRSVVLGMRSPAEVRENVASFHNPPPQALWLELADEGLIRW